MLANRSHIVALRGTLDARVASTMQMTFVELNARRVCASTAVVAPHSMSCDGSCCFEKKERNAEGFLICIILNASQSNSQSEWQTHTNSAQWDWNRCESYVYRTDTCHRRPQNSLFKWITLRKWLNSSQRPVHDEFTLQLRSSRTMTYCHHPKIPTRKSMTICFCAGISIYMSVVATILDSNTNHHPLEPFAL